MNMFGKAVMFLILIILLSGCDTRDVIVAAGKSLTTEEAEALIKKQDERIKLLEAQNSRLQAVKNKQTQMQEDVERLKSMLTPPEKI